MSHFGMKDWLLEVQKGNVPNHSAILKFGTNFDIDTASAEDVWGQGGDFTEPTTARTHDIVSANANDTSAGTGARTVFVEGLDASHVEQSETVTMNGTTDVATASTYTMIHRMYVLTAGSASGNLGNITATAQTDSTVTNFMRAGKQQTTSAIYMVPASTVAYVYGWYMGVSDSSGVGANVDFELFTKDTGAVYRIESAMGIVSGGTSHVSHLFAIPLVVSALSIIKVRATTSANNTIVHAGFDLVLDSS